VPGYREFDPQSLINFARATKREDATH